MSLNTPIQPTDSHQLPLQSPVPTHVQQHVQPYQQHSAMDTHSIQNPDQNGIPPPNFQGLPNPPWHPQHQYPQPQQMMFQQGQFFGPMMYVPPPPQIHVNMTNGYLFNNQGNYQPMNIQPPEKPRPKFNAGAKAYKPSESVLKSLEGQQKPQELATSFSPVEKCNNSSVIIKSPLLANGQTKNMHNGEENVKAVTNGHSLTTKYDDHGKTEPEGTVPGLRFITTTEEVSLQDLKIPLVIESNSNEFEKTVNDENEAFITTISNSAHNPTPTTNGSNQKSDLQLIFKIDSPGTTCKEEFRPFVLGSTMEAFSDQRKRFSKDDDGANQGGASYEIDIISSSDEITAMDRSEQVQTHNLEDNDQADVDPDFKQAQPDTSAPLQWAAIVQKAAQKPQKQPFTHTSTKPSSPCSTATPKKEDTKLVPTVSNVLEPLGSVVLKSMFDKSFQNHFNSSSAKSKIPKIIPRGLVNTGNICFMSSIVQLLLYCEPFYETMHIISNKAIQSLHLESQTPLFESLVELYKYFNIDTTSSKKKFGDSIMPTEFYKSISSNERFQHLKWGQQEDAEEFFGYLLDGLHEEFISAVSHLNLNDAKALMNSIVDDEHRQIIKNELKKYTNEGITNNEDNNEINDNDKNKGNENDGWKEVGSGSKKNKASIKRTLETKSSPISQLFGGSFRSVLNVPKQKESQSITLDPFQQIQLDISSSAVETLEDAFKELSKVEEIPSYKLNNGTEVTAKKQTFIDKLPEVLVIHLKRFAFTNGMHSLASHTSEIEKFSHSGFGKIEKISKKIQFKHELKIPDEIISSTTKKFNPDYATQLNYKLIGVVYHIGKNSDGGHYTVDVLHEKNQWLCIDDTLISELKPEEVLNGNGHDESIKTAYVLMYQRV